MLAGGVVGDLDTLERDGFHHPQLAGARGVWVEKCLPAWVLKNLGLADGYPVAV